MVDQEAAGLYPYQEVWKCIIRLCLALPAVPGTEDTILTVSHKALVGLTSLAVKSTKPFVMSFKTMLLLLEIAVALRSSDNLDMSETSL